MPFTAAGGRYDNLVSSLIQAASGDSKKVPSVPCVGISFGLDRIFALLYPKWIEKGLRQKGTLAFVIAVGDGLLQERVKLVAELREAGIKVCIETTRGDGVLNPLDRLISWPKRSRR